MPSILRSKQTDYAHPHTYHLRLRCLFRCRCHRRRPRPRRHRRHRSPPACRHRRLEGSAVAHRSNGSCCSTDDRCPALPDRSRLRTRRMPPGICCHPSSGYIYTKGSPIAVVNGFICLYSPIVLCDVCIVNCRRPHRLPTFATYTRQVQLSRIR